MKKMVFVLLVLGFSMFASEAFANKKNIRGICVKPNPVMVKNIRVMEIGDGDAPITKTAKLFDQAEVISNHDIRRKVILSNARLATKNMFEPR